MKDESGFVEKDDNTLGGKKDGGEKQEPEPLVEDLAVNIGYDFGQHWTNIRHRLSNLQSTLLLAFLPGNVIVP